MLAALALNEMENNDKREINKVEVRQLRLDDYAELAPRAKELLGDKAIFVVAGAPACTPELEAKGLTNFINVKSNVLETLKFYLKELGI